MFLLFLEVTTSKEEDEDDEAFSPSLLSTKIALNVLDRRGKTSSSPPFSLSFLVFFLKAKFAGVLRIPLLLKEEEEEEEEDDDDAEKNAPTHLRFPFPFPRFHSSSARRRLIEDKEEDKQEDKQEEEERR
jgi:hypothetical protein